MKFTFTATVELTMEHKDGNPNSSIDSVDIFVDIGNPPVGINLDVSKPLDKKVYLNNKGKPTIAGTKAITVALISGLMGNIEYGAQQGFWDKNAHRAYILDELLEKLDMMDKLEEGVDKKIE